MKILVLNGSPKRENSDTLHITRAFLEGMQAAASQDIHIIDVIDKHIEYCTGCFACKRNGGICIPSRNARVMCMVSLFSRLGLPLRTRIFMGSLLSSFCRE